MSNPTRRDLLKGGAMAGLAGVVGCKAPSAAQPSATPQKAQAHWEAPRESSPGGGRSQESAGGACR